MAFPLFKDEIAFVNNPLDTAQTWVDVTADVTSRGLRRGRQTEDETASTGTGGLVLIDDTRKYDPENTAGTYYPNVKPMKQMRSSASLDGGSTWLPVFKTFVDIENGWQRADGEPGAVTVTVPGNDAFDLLANDFLGPSQTFASQLTGARITAILSAIGWPVAWQSIDAGNEQMQAVAAGNAVTDALSLIRDAETAEVGYFFVDPAGIVTFQDRHHRLVSPYTVSQATFCDATNYSAGRLLYDNVVTRQSRVYNDIQVTRDSGTLQESTDAASQAVFGNRTLSKQTKQTTDASAALMSSWLLSQKKDSYVRYEELTLKPGTDTQIWTQVLTRQIGDRITVIRTPSGSSTVQTVDCIIEGVSLDVGPGIDATCVWRLSPAPQVVGWVLGDAANGLLGQTTRLVF